eukprot:TRINITY_DN9315_c0_g2_i1.p1 TRINITY_DN9315_c0_g2~~TRINITY_DN9315_c0_g2_i1.p1  ORF type:complete len:266 (+),score=87.33 TRINITY_DN9315_c0_g2_i1:484-1281(+)
MCYERMAVAYRRLCEDDPEMCAQLDHHIKEAIKVCKECSNSEGLGKCYLQWGHSYTERRDLASAVDCYLNAYYSMPDEKDKEALDYLTEAIVSFCENGFRLGKDGSEKVLNFFDKLQRPKLLACSQARLYLLESLGKWREISKMGHDREVFEAVTTPEVIYASYAAINNQEGLKELEMLVHAKQKAGHAWQELKLTVMLCWSLWLLNQQIEAMRVAARFLSRDKEFAERGMGGVLWDNHVAYLRCVLKRSAAAGKYPLLSHPDVS